MVDGLMQGYSDHPFFLAVYSRDTHALVSLLDTDLFNQPPFDTSIGQLSVSNCYEGILHVLEQYTLEEVIRRNFEGGKIPCIKRPNIRAVLLDPNQGLLCDSTGNMLIGTNAIIKTVDNKGGTYCPRMAQNLGSTANKTICALSCGHTGCAETHVIEQAHDLGYHLNGTKLVLFGHTEGPCTICAELMIENGISSAIIGSPPVGTQHNHFDLFHTLYGVKQIVVSETIRYE